MAIRNELQQIVSLVSDQELEFLALNGCNYAANNPNMAEEEQCVWHWVMSTIAAEAERRKVEPLWRKARRFALAEKRKVEPLWQEAKRFALHNSDTLQLVGATAAVVAIGGIVLGPWLGVAAGAAYLSEQK